MYSIGKAGAGGTRGSACVCLTLKSTGQIVRAGDAVDEGVIDSGVSGTGIGAGSSASKLGVGGGDGGAADSLDNVRRGTVGFGVARKADNGKNRDSLRKSVNSSVDASVP